MQRPEEPLIMASSTRGFLGYVEVGCLLLLYERDARHAPRTFLAFPLPSVYISSRDISEILLTLYCTEHPVCVRCFFLSTPPHSATVAS